jgi:hypothetical protein
MPARSNQDRDEAAAMELAHGDAECDLCGVPGCSEREGLYDAPFDDDVEGFGCVLGTRCCMPELHYPSECYSAEDAEEYHRQEELRREVLDHGAIPAGAVVLEKALVRIAASAKRAGDLPPPRYDDGAHERLLNEEWPPICREALSHAEHGPHQPAPEGLVRRMAELRGALAWVLDYGRCRLERPAELAHAVCVEVLDVAERALEGPEDEVEAIEVVWDSENEDDLPF